MHDTALYQYLLGLKSPWTVSRVQLNITGQCVDVWAEHPEDAAWACPHGTKKLPLYDHAEERTWRPLDGGQFQTHLHARIPRVACGEHGVVQITVPWAEPRSRFTLLFERLALDVLSQCDVSGATRILRISWDEARGLMQRAVTRGRARKTAQIVRRVGGDEKAAAKGHRYLTLVCDLDEGTVEHSAEDRTQESLNGYYAGLTQEQLDGIEAGAMDRWEPYIQATRAQVPDAAEKIVFDRFHVMGHIGKAVDTVRKQEHRALMESGDETLKGSTYLWLDSRENVPERRREEFRRTEAPGAQGGTGVGHQRGVAPSVALRLPGIRLEVLETVVLLGDAQPAGADSQGGRDGPPAHREHPDLLPTSGDQRDERGAQQSDPEDQEHGLRLPQHRALQDGDLLPLRRA